MTNQANRGLEGVIANLIDMNAMQRESIDRIGEKVDRMVDKMDDGFAKLTASQDKLTTSIEKLTERIDNLAMVTDSNRIIVNNLIALAASQQETVNKLLTAKAV